MGLVNEDYYYDEYLGEPVSYSDFPIYEKKAERLVLGLIRKTADEVEAFPEDLQTKIKDAICVEIEYMWENGLVVAISGKTGSGFTVGKVSVQAGASAALAGAKSMICPAVYAMLETTGLLNPAVATAAEPWPATRGWI